MTVLSAATSFNTRFAVCAIRHLALTGNGFAPFGYGEPVKRQLREILSVGHAFINK